VRSPGDDPIEELSWQFGLLIAGSEEAVARHPAWQVRSHKKLCTDSVASFRPHFSDLGLEQRDESERYLVESDVPGEGFATTRRPRTCPNPGSAGSTTTTWPRCAGWSIGFR
jgi:hypothetical protein